jgi:O-antigen biosynthesis protein
MELLGPPFNILRNQSNLGFIKTVNLAAKMIQGKYLLLLNSDIELHADWLDPAVELMEANDKIGVTGLKLVFPPNEQKEITIQSCGGWYDANRSPFHRYLSWLANDSRVNKTEKVNWVTGAALLTRKDLFDKLGGLDEAYNMGYFEDTDYCERVKELGYEIWYCAEATATHLVGQSMSKRSEEEQRKGAKNFYDNARLFHTRWAEKIKPDVQYVATQF